MASSNDGPPAPGALYRALTVRYQMPVDRFPMLRDLLERGAYFPPSTPENRVLDYLYHDADERTAQLFREHWPTLIQKGLDLDDAQHMGAHNVLFEWRYNPDKVTHALAWGVDPLFKIGPEQRTAREKIEHLMATTAHPDLLLSLEESAILLRNAELEKLSQLRDAAVRMRWARVHGSESQPSRLRDLPPEIRAHIVNQAVPRLQPLEPAQP